MKPTTYSELVAQGDHTTMLQPLYADEACADFAKVSHGHVFKRKDGLLARCGGPSLCPTCKVEDQILSVLKGKK